MPSIKEKDPGRIGPIPIRLLSGPRNTSISLQGTILTYREDSWNHQLIAEIPIENLILIESKQLMGIRLIRSLLWIFAAMLLPVMVGVWIPLVGPYLGLLLALILLSFSLHQFCRFFRREAVMEYRVEEEGGSMEFWVEKSNRESLEFLRREVESRKGLVRERLEHGYHDSIGGLFYNPLGHLLSELFFAFLPALATESPWFLLLGVIPLWRHLGMTVAYIQSPVSIRDAFAALKKNRVREAIGCFEEHLKTEPSDHDAASLLFRLYIRVEDFIKAAALLKSMEPILDGSVVEFIQEELLLAMRIAERKKT
ncbi:MAG: hypothetical protein H6752_01030 [Candidatus Omnitrophica bacterium]|nr:hypothetical protein [Candidatus Omnitrophota bacterium]